MALLPMILRLRIFVDGLGHRYDSRIRGDLSVLLAVGRG